MTTTTTCAQHSAGPYGATPDDWQHFSTTLGLTRDLLPVVSNPTATISPKSSVKQLGKIPSRYNNDRNVVGIPDWTAQQTADAQVAKWQRDSDLGICLQTRSVRAIDIDIADAGQAQRVRDAIEVIAGDFPLRMRSNSGKCLLIFKMPGEFSKRILRTEHGIVEFLATGQQFIAVGTHPSGVRYEWPGGLPTDIPHLGREEFEQLWAALDSTFSIAGSVTLRPGQKPTTARNSADANDPVLEYLERTGWIKSFGSDGKAHITCPWEEGHSDGKEGSDSATSYFPAGVGGFAQGHFRCLHASCAHRQDGDYLEATGYSGDGFGVIEVKPGDTALPAALPAFTRDRQGKIEATVKNLAMALRRADMTGWHIGYDSFNDALMRSDFGLDEPQWVPFTDSDYTRLRITLATGKQGGFNEISKEMVRDAVLLVADDNKFDSAVVWLNRQQWDGVPRVERFWSTYFKTADTPYTRAASRYTWTALAGRVLSPGCQADMVPILIGKQGTRKTTGVSAMAPSADTFVELSLDVHDTDLARKMRGKLVAELGELKGLFSKDSDAIKQWITRRKEEWTPKYKEFGTTFNRRMLMIGTTNRNDVLADDDGEERRWLPMVVVGGIADVDAIRRDCAQLWAEGAVLFTSSGVDYREAERLAKDVHGDHRIDDPWTKAVGLWLEEVGMDGAVRNGDRMFYGTDLMQSALGSKRAVIPS